MIDFVKDYIKRRIKPATLEDANNHKDELFRLAETVAEKEAREKEER